MSNYGDIQGAGEWNTPASETASGSANEELRHIAGDDEDAIRRAMAALLWIVNEKD